MIDLGGYIEWRKWNNWDWHIALAWIIDWMVSLFMEKAKTGWEFWDEDQYFSFSNIRFEITVRYSKRCQVNFFMILKLWGKINTSEINMKVGIKWVSWWDQWLIYRKWRGLRIKPLGISNFQVRYKKLRMDMGKTDQ